MDASKEILIRQAQPGDWTRIREICCKTGNSGAPIEAARWPFFADYWVGPYERLRPEWTFVAVAGGHVAGYLTGCPDTARFNRERILGFTLPLLLRVLSCRYCKNNDTRRFVRRTLGLEKRPEQRFAQTLRDRLDVEFPAHLHINLDMEFRSSGIGQALINHYLERLRGKSIAGVHLFCGAGPLKFYERAGFHELESIEFAPGLRIYALGRATH